MIPFSSSRSPARRPLFAFALALALGALHCGDEALILNAPPAPAGETPVGPDDETGEHGIEVSVGEGDGSSPSAPDGSNSNGQGGAASAPAAGSPSDEPPVGTPSSGGVTTGECQPRGVGGPFWLTEGETIEIAVECATGAALGNDLRFANLPANAAFDPGARSLRFAPGLDQAGVYALDVELQGTSEHGSIEVQVADRFGAAANVPVDPATYIEELGLPVLHLDVDPGINEDGYLPAAITYRGHSFTGAEAKYRGQTSLRYPKKSFTLKFTKEDRFGDAERAPGFVEKRKITLTTTFDDTSNLRARLAFELWNRMGGHVKVQSYNAVVYLNGEFWGLYTITDHVDGRLMEDHGFFQDGNLYKARTHDANFRLTRTEDPGGDKLSLSEGYTKEEGTPLEGEPGANADLEDLVSWVATSTSAAFLSELDTRLARREYEDWWMLVSLVFAGDSAGKNSYHYRDPRGSAPDGRFHVVPWDFNDSFGQTYYNDHPGREADDGPEEELAGYNRLFERLLTEPTTRASIVSRYRSLLEGEWALPSVLASFDAWAAENEPVARRDESKWGALFASHFADLRSTSPVTHSEEMAYMRQWIIDRWSFLADYY